MKQQNSTETITVRQAIQRFADRSNRLLMLEIAYDLLTIADNNCLTYEEAVGSLRRYAESLKKGDVPK